MVLVEVRDKVVVLVEAGKNLAIPSRASAQFLGQRYSDALGLADPIRVYVLVVVVIDELKQMPGGIAVVDVAASVGHEGRGAVVGVQVERLAVRKKRIQRIRRGQVKGLGRFPRGGQLAELAVYYALEVLIGEPLKAPVDHVLASQIKALEIFDVEIETDQFRGRGQAVLEAEEALVRPVGDVVLGLKDRQKDLAAEPIELFVGADFHPVVVGHDQLEFHLLDILEAGGRFGGLEIVADVVGQQDGVCALGLEHPFFPNASFHQRHDALLHLAVNQDSLQEQNRPFVRRIGRIVGDADDHLFHVAQVLRPRQHALERVLAQVELAVRVMGIHPSKADLAEVPHLRQPPAAQQPRGTHRSIAGGTLGYRAKARRADPRREQGRRVLVGQKVPLQTVKRGLGKRQRCQSRADGVAHRERRVELALAGRGDDQAAEKAAKTRAFEDLAAKGLGVVLGPIVDSPPAGDVVAQGVVLARAF